MRVSGKPSIHGLTPAWRAHGRSAALLGVAFRTILTLVTVFLGLSPISPADDFWKHKPPAQWALAEALKVVRHSPWARIDVVMFRPQEPGADFTVPTGTKHDDPDAIDQKGNCWQTGRSAAPLAC